jgi:hypothetical protein
MNPTGEGSNGEPADVSRGKLTVFINYRREDTPGQAGRLSERLKQRFGEDNVYFDVDEKSGIDWLAQIEARGAAAGVVLALIGRDWLDALKARSAPALRGRLDYARREIEWALSAWSGDVIPVLVDTTMPDKYKLPRSLRGICAKNATELRHTSFDRDVDHLIEQIEQRGGVQPPPSGAATEEAKEPTPEAAPRDERRPASDVPEPSTGHYVKVGDAMLQGRVVLFLGPSVRGSLPDTACLAARLADQYGLPPNSCDLAEVAQRVLLTEGEEELYGSIKQILAAASRPMPVHRFLAELPRLLRQRGLPPSPQLIISANYDWALERAFEAANEPFDYAVYMANSGRFVHFPWGDDDGEPIAVTIDDPSEYQGFPIGEEVERTVIVKIHGSVDGEDPLAPERNNYLITEDHYINFLPSRNIHDHLPIQILEKLMRSRCLFLGYTLRDWNARLLLRRIWHDKELRERSWSVLHDPDDLELVTWRTVGNVELLSANTTNYVTALRSALIDRQAAERRPQLAGS